MSDFIYLRGSYTFSFIEEIILYFLLFKFKRFQDNEATDIHKHTSAQFLGSFKDINNNIYLYLFKTELQNNFMY